jgi:hypothetical protein
MFQQPFKHGSKQPNLGCLSFHYPHFTVLKWLSKHKNRQLYLLLRKLFGKGWHFLDVARNGLFTLPNPCNTLAAWTF